MLKPTNMALFEYWNALRAGRPVPYRTDVDPGRISGLLDRIFLLESRPDGHIAFRLAGSTLCSQFGGDLRGRDFTSLWPERDGEALQGIIRDIARRAEAAILEFEAWNRSGDDVAFELLLLPLARAMDIDRFIGAAVPVGAPDWPAFGHITVCRLLRRTLFAPDRLEPARTAAGENVAGRIELPSPPIQIVRTPTAKPKQILRVVEGGLAHMPRLRTPE